MPLNIHTQKHVPGRSSVGINSRNLRWSVDVRLRGRAAPHATQPDTTPGTQELSILIFQTSATHHKQNATTTKPTCLLPRLWVVPSDPAAPFRNTDEKNFESLGLATMLPVCTEAWSFASPQTSRTLDSAETL